LSKRIKIVAIILLVLLFFAFSPCFLPPNYHSLSERKRLIVETAAKSTFRHLDEGVYLLTLRVQASSSLLNNFNYF